jgi:GTP-binding protein HflX
LTGARVLVEDKLFATLDPTTRRLRLPTNQNVLLSDTVGFIRKLPHRLVEAFKATLEEVVQADLLLHVVDVSHPQAEEQILAVNTVLEEIGAAGKPTLMVFNKMDRFEKPEVLGKFRERFPQGVGISAKTGAGFDALEAELGTLLRPIRRLLKLAIPHDASAVIARLHEVGQVVERDYAGEWACFQARIPPYLLPEFEKYIVTKDASDEFHPHQRHGAQRKAAGAAG